MTNEISLACRETGQGSSTVVLLHGLFGQARNLGRLARELGEQHHVIAMDLPGHGESPHQPGYTIDSMAASVQHSLKQRDIARYKVLGHSLGGKVAMATGAWLARRSAALAGCRYRAGALSHRDTQLSSKRWLALISSPAIAGRCRCRVGADPRRHGAAPIPVAEPGAQQTVATHGNLIWPDCGPVMQRCPMQ